MPSQHAPDDQPDPPPLGGLLVADFCRVLAGPLASMFLGDLGAKSSAEKNMASASDVNERRSSPPCVGVGPKSGVTRRSASATAVAFEQWR
jgi:hypothetical protein